MAMLLREDNLFHQQCPRDYLNAQAGTHGIDLTVVGSATALRQAMANAEVLVTNEIPPGSIAGSTRLMWIHAIAAGVEGIMVPEVMNSEVCVTNSAGTMAPEVAEHALALVLALTRRIDLSIKAQAEKRWASIRRDHPPIGLSDLTLAIIGYGNIGRAIGERARPFGLKVIGLRRHASPDDGVAEEIVGRDRLRDVLSRADIVVVALPIVEQTRALFGRAEFHAMKRRAVFINIGRGAVIDEAALAAALGAGDIAGAACDVFIEEPLPRASPLWTAPNFIVSPHLAGASEQVWIRVIDLIFENLERIRQGEQPLNKVDKASGY